MLCVLRARVSADPLRLSGWPLPLVSIGSLSQSLCAQWIASVFTTVRVGSFPISVPLEPSGSIIMDMETVKNLLRCPKGSANYVAGVKGFVDFAFKDKPEDCKICCPCQTCVHTTLQPSDEMFAHLVCNGILESYDQWDFHGDPSVQETSNQQPNSHSDESLVNIGQLIQDSIGHLYDDTCMADGDAPVKGPNLEAQKFYKLLEDSKKPLWTGCELTELTLFVLLFNVKSMNKWSDKSFGDLLEVLHMAIPNGKELPKNFYESKKLISKFSLGYENIDACPNNCQLYWKEKKDDDFCPTCKASRWKDREPESILTKKERRKATPCKVLRYFPIKESLKRQFMCKETAAVLRWHDEERVKDDVLRHPADAPAWKRFDEKFPVFASESRNLRFWIGY
ncbi:hypothetical protein U9M48_013029 [Paspalum notatum var. saurae]|uniref:Transposase-associated domain-containing protein n=1 Tax=Paspalum notatum var. saurae TaxID=547442 RepID=A0AAQ3T0U7_PASNO